MEFFEKLKKTFALESREFKYNFEAMRQLQDSLIRAVEKIKKEIDQNAYDVLLSDDAGGRLPTLALKDILTRRIEGTNPDLSPEKKRDALKILFIAGGRFTENNLALRKFFKEIKPNVKKRVLLVTEYISSGESIERLMKFLDEEDISYDILAVMGDNSEKYYQELFKDHSENHRLVVGDYKREEPKIYSAVTFGGVRKPYMHHTAHSRALSKLKDPKIPEEKLKEDMEKAREDTHVLAQAVLKKVWGEK